MTSCFRCPSTSFDHSNVSNLIAAVTFTFKLNISNINCMHCQKSGTKWQPSMRNTVKMAVNSCKEMYGERKNFANIAVISSWHGSSLRDSNYDKCSTSYGFHRKTLNTHKIYSLPGPRRCLPSLYSPSISVPIHSLKILMKISG